MSGTAVVTFWLVALVLIVVPGADWAFVVSAGLRGRSVLPAVSGLVTGYAVMTAAVAAGVGAAVAGSPVVLTWLTVVGGAYLIWHGASTAAHPASPSPCATTTATGWATFARGIGVSGLNPKGLLLFLALLPQFTDPRGRWPVAGQMAVLGATFVATCAAFYLTLGSLTRTVLSTRPTPARAVSRLAGLAMIGIGTTLLLDRLI